MYICVTFNERKKCRGLSSGIRLWLPLDLQNPFRLTRKLTKHASQKNKIKETKIDENIGQSLAKFFVG